MSLYDREAQAFRAGYTGGERSRNAEIERLTEYAEELRAALEGLMQAFGGVTTHAQQAKWDIARAALAKNPAPTTAEQLGIDPDGRGKGSGRLHGRPLDEDGAIEFRSERNEIFPSQDDYNALSRLHGEKFDLACSFRDTLCRTLDKAERYARQGKPLPQDEIDAMTGRLVEDTKKLYGEGRPIKPHRSGGGEGPPDTTLSTGGSQP